MLMDLAAVDAISSSLSLVAGLPHRPYLKVPTVQPVSRPFAHGHGSWALYVRDRYLKEFREVLVVIAADGARPRLTLVAGLPH